MSYIAKGYEAAKDTAVGTGECVAYVQHYSEAPSTPNWKQGEKVRDAKLDAGTVIATFVNGVYPSKKDGSSHAAIYVSQNTVGILVWDQWQGHPAQTRTIRFKGGAGLAVDDGDAFYVVD